MTIASKKKLSPIFLIQASAVCSGKNRAPGRGGDPDMKHVLLLVRANGQSSLCGDGTHATVTKPKVA